MTAIHRCALPPESLLQRYVGGGSYADCYVTEVAAAISHAAFVETFYTTRVFKLERLILRLAVARPSTDIQARQLADGTRDSFAAWSVEERTADQLLLRDISGRTRSWLMVEPAASSSGVTSTRLFFGSAVVPKVHRVTGRARLGFVFTALLGFHRLYSRVLLWAARARLAR